MKFVFSEVARRTLAEVVSHYVEIDRQYGIDGAGLAEKVYLEVNSAIGRLLLFPQQGVLFEKTEQVYRLNLDFNLALFYVFNDEFVKAVAVVDLRRDVSAYRAIIKSSKKL